MRYWRTAMWKTDSEKRMLEEKLQRQLEAGEITAEEAEMEWQDFMHKEEVWSEW